MGSKVALLDTSAIVAYMVRTDKFHLWAVSVFKTLPSSIATCESVISECYHLLGKEKGGGELLSEMLNRGIVSVVPLSSEIPALIRLIEKYEDLPMSFADACLVRMAELNPNAVIVTADSDFRTYRINKNRKIPLLSPL